MVGFSHLSHDSITPWDLGLHLGRKVVIVLFKSVLKVMDHLPRKIPSPPKNTLKHTPRSGHLISKGSQTLRALPCSLIENP